MASESGQMDLGHWLLRLVAYIIDSIIIFIPVFIIWTFVLLAVVFTDVFFFAWGGWLVLPLLFGVIQMLYFIVLDVVWGGTIGKRVLGLQVQLANGGKVDYGKSFIRNISKIFWVFLILDWLIGVATAGADRRQKYTDRVAGTTVVAVRQAFASATSAPPPPPPPPPSA